MPNTKKKSEYTLPTKAFRMTKEWIHLFRVLKFERFWLR